MKVKLHSASFWNRFKLPAKFLAALVVVGIAGQAQAQITYTPVFSNVWVLPAGTYNDLTNRSDSAATTVRGAAIDPVTTNVLFSSTYAGTNNGAGHIATLAFANGSNYLANLNGSGLASGTALLTGTRVADDGTVYCVNLSGAPASVFKIYKWPSDTDIATAPINVSTVVSGSSFQWRAGDYTDLRGSGINTEIVVVGNGSGANITTNFVVFRPTDASCTSFTNFSIFIPGSSASICLCGAGVTFEGTTNSIWIRQAGSANTRHIVYDPTTMTAICDRTNTVDQTVCQGLKYYEANGVRMLATVQANTASGAAQIARVFQIPASPTGAFVSVLNSNLPAVAGSVNGNGLGNVDARNGYFVFGAPGHGMSFFSVGFATNSPPSSLSISSSGSTFVAGYNLNATFTGTAAGSAPLKYQWYFASATATNPILAGITNIYTVTNVATANAGGYFFIVTNLYGKATSSVSSISVLPNGGSSIASNLWSLAPGSRPYLTTGDTQRGLGYDTNLNRVVLVTRSPTNGIILLDGNTGADVGNLDISALLAITPPGTFPISMCGVADDGVVYVADLITSASSDTFAIYSWGSADPSASINQAYAGNPGSDLGWTGSNGRIGDTMAVRGAGVNTEILCTFRNGTNACIFTTADGVNFTPNIIYITNLVASIAGTDPFTGASPIGLGVSFGAGNTFWAKSTSYNLRQISFDLTSGNGAVIGSYAMPSTEAPIGVDPINGYAALIGVNETPMNLPIYDITTPFGPTINTLVDREVYGANNANGNGTGSVVFDVAGGRIFSLSSNSGILALTYAPRLNITPAPHGATLSWTGPGTLQSSTNLLTGWSNASSTSPYTSTAAAQLFFRVVR